MQVQGATHETELYEIFDADPAELILEKLASREAFAAGIAAFSAVRFDDAVATFDEIVAHSPRRSHDGILRATLP